MNNIIKMSFIAIIAVFVMSCNNSTAGKSGEAVYKATINGAAGMSVIVKDADPFSDFADTINVGGDGSFIFKDSVDGSAYYNVLLAGARMQYPLFLMPGDTFFMTTDAQHFFDAQKLSGTAALYNSYLTDYSKASNSFQQSLRTIFAMPEAAAMAAVDSVNESRKALYDDFAKKIGNVDPLFAKNEKARIQYEDAILRLIYPMYYEYFAKTTFEPSATYDSYLGALNLNDESLLSLDIYRSFLSSYVNMKMQKFYNDSAFMATSPSMIAKQLEIIKSNFTSKKIIALLAYESVKSHVSQSGIAEYDLYYDTFKELCPIPKFQAEIDAMLSEWKHLKKGADAFEFTFVDMKGNKVSMSDFKGKYVYIDVWATWCSPCRAEIPHLKRIEEKFHGKDIVFISISVDQTQEPWREMVTNDNLKGVQLWAGQSPEFSKYYKITGIPRFMLFDKEGKIYDVNAKRPSGGIENEIANLPGL